MFALVPSGIAGRFDLDEEVAGPSWIAAYFANIHLGEMLDQVRGSSIHGYFTL